MSNNDCEMNKGYHAEEAAEDTENQGNWFQAWRTTHNLPAGDYIVIVSFLAYNDLGFIGSKYRIQMNDTLNILPECQPVTLNGEEKVPVSRGIHVNIASGGNQNFDFDIQGNQGGEVAKISDKTIAIIRVCL